MKDIDTKALRAVLKSTTIMWTDVIDPPMVRALLDEIEDLRIKLNEQARAQSVELVAAFRGLQKAEKRAEAWKEAAESQLATISELFEDADLYGVCGNPGECHCGFCTYCTEMMALMKGGSLKAARDLEEES